MKSESRQVAAGAPVTHGRMDDVASSWKLGTAALLAISALLGLAMLATDRNLWTYAPTHAYGLIGFVLVDLAALALVALRGRKMVFGLAAVWGALQALIMLSDIATGAQSFGMAPADFARYLFGLGFYDSNHIAFLFPALFAVNVILAFVAFFASRKSR